MGDMGEVFNAMREMDAERRSRNLAAADPTGWTIHTEYHWSRDLWRRGLPRIALIGAVRVEVRPGEGIQSGGGRCRVAWSCARRRCYV